MAHLVCATHGRRTLVISDGAYIHRNDGSVCEGTKVRMSNEKAAYVLVPEVGGNPLKRSSEPVFMSKAEERRYNASRDIRPAGE